jgi:hypothetical protein
MFIIKRAIRFQGGSCITMTLPALFKTEKEAKEACYGLNGDFAALFEAHRVISDAMEDLGMMSIAHDTYELKPHSSIQVPSVPQIENIGQ